MIDRVVVLALLRVLDQVRGHPLPQRILFNHINIELSSPLPSSELIEQLNFAKDKGWVDYSVDDFKEKRWWITDAGQVELSEHNR